MKVSNDLAIANMIEQLANTRTLTVNGVPMFLKEIFRTNRTGRIERRLALFYRVPSKVYVSPARYDNQDKSAKEVIDEYVSCRWGMYKHASPFDFNFLVLSKRAEKKMVELSKPSFNRREVASYVGEYIANNKTKVKEKFVAPIFPGMTIDGVLVYAPTMAMLGALTYGYLRHNTTSKETIPRVYNYGAYSSGATTKEDGKGITIQTFAGSYDATDKMEEMMMANSVNVASDSYVWPVGETGDIVYESFRDNVRDYLMNYGTLGYAFGTVLRDYRRIYGSHLKDGWQEKFMSAGKTNLMGNSARLSAILNDNENKDFVKDDQWRTFSPGTYSYYYDWRSV